ncbi:MAG: hypothetical protein R3C14_09470 [Caldilineaceae bacterium]
MNHPDPIPSSYQSGSHNFDYERTNTSSPEINRLLTAAVINRRICHLLLTNPLAALTAGHRNEAFQLSEREVELICAIRATSLQDFVQQLLTPHSGKRSETDSEVVCTQHHLRAERAMKSQVKKR